MKTAALTALLATTLARSACAQTWAEVGDAGDLPGTAQTPIGVGALASITGTLTPSPGNADMYLINIVNPAAFSASTVGVPLLLDTQIFLFTTTGTGIAFNDDAYFRLMPLVSALPVGNPLYSGLAPGPYLLALSGFNNDPSSAGGLIFPGAFPGVFGPTGPGGGSSVSSWAGTLTTLATGTYTITLTGAAFVPAPVGIVLLGVAALAAPRRQRG